MTFTREPLCEELPVCRKTAFSSWYQRVRPDLPGMAGNVRIFLLSLGLLFFASPDAAGQIVINEILPNGTVEVKNIGSETVDISSYWLCDFPTYEQFADLNIICGSTMLEAGAIMAIDNFNTINGADGEMAIYTNSSFGSPTGLIDYVEWGFTGHQRSGVAAEAGVWAEGDFVPAFAEGESLAYSGSGNESSQWTAGAPTICEENPAEMCEVNTGDITLEDGNTSTSICVDGNPDPLEVVTSGGTEGTERGWIITDDAGNILALPPAPPFDLDGAGPGVCQIWYVRYDAGNFGGNEVKQQPGGPDRLF